MSWMMIAAGVAALMCGVVNGVLAAYGACMRVYIFEKEGIEDAHS